MGGSLALVHVTDAVLNQQSFEKGSHLPKEKHVAQGKDSGVKNRLGTV